jgi:hypothetical protein
MVKKKLSILVNMKTQMGRSLQLFKFSSRYSVWNYGEFVNFLVLFWKKFLSLVCKSRGSGAGSGSKIYNFGSGSGSLRSNNFGSGRIRIRNTAANTRVSDPYSFYRSGSSIWNEYGSGSSIFTWIKKNLFIFVLLWFLVDFKEYRY